MLGLETSSSAPVNATSPRKAARRVSFVLVEIREGHDAPAAFAEQDDLVGLVEFELLGFAAVLVDVEIADLDLALGIVAREVGVFAQQAGDIAEGLSQLFVGRVGRDRNDDADVAVEAVEVGSSLRRERVTALLGEVEAPGVVEGDVIEPGRTRSGTRSPAESG